MELNHFCQSVPVFLEQLSRNQTTNCLNLGERLSVRSQEYMDILTVIYSRLLLGIEMLSLSNEDGDIQILRQLISDVDIIIQVLSHYLVHYNDVTNSISDQASECSTVLRTGHPGRPRYVIDKSIIEGMSLLGYSYEDRARLLGISSRTLRRHRHNLGLPVGGNYASLSNEELDTIISSILRVSLKDTCCRKSSIDYITRWRSLRDLHTKGRRPEAV